MSNADSGAKETADEVKEGTDSVTGNTGKVTGPAGKVRENAEGAPQPALEQADSQDAIPPKKKPRRAVRKGNEQVLESEAVSSFRLVNETPTQTPTALTGNDASLLENVPPHWGKR